MDERTPPHVVQQIAGHAALYATMTIYACASTEQRRAALDRLGDHLATTTRQAVDDPATVT